MGTFPTFLLRLLKLVLIFAIVAMIIVVAIQIIARLLIPSPPPWTEEAARLFFVYLVSIGAGLSVHEKAYVNVDTFFNLLPRPWQPFMHLFIQVCIATLMIFMGIHAWRFVELGGLQTSPSLGIPMSYVFSSMLLLAFLVLFFTVMEIFKLLRQITKLKTL